MNEKKLDIITSHLRRPNENYKEPVMGAKEGRPYLDELMKALPKSYSVTALNISGGSYNELPKNSFTWEAKTYCGWKPFATKYVGDYMYETYGMLDDELMFVVLFDSHNWPDYNGREDEIGDDMCAAFLKAFDEENQYNHSAFTHERTERVTQRCSEISLLQERSELLARREKYENNLLNGNGKPELISKVIDRIDERLNENRTHLSLKLIID